MLAKLRKAKKKKGKRKTADSKYIRKPSLHALNPRNEKSRRRRKERNSEPESLKQIGICSIFAHCHLTSHKKTTQENAKDPKEKEDTCTFSYPVEQQQEGRVFLRSTRRPDRGWVSRCRMRSARTTAVERCARVKFRCSVTGRRTEGEFVFVSCWPAIVAVVIG